MPADSSSSYTLAIDTSLGATSVCVLPSGGAEPVAAESVAMDRGHAEALLPMVDRVVSRGAGGFAPIRRIAVTVGPGSFTGIRVGVAAARGLGLACGVPVVGVSTLSALAAPAIATAARAVIVAAIDARHGSVYVQSFSIDGGTQFGPAAMTVADAVRALGRGRCLLIGSGAPMMAIEAWSVGLDVAVDEKGVIPDIAFVARLGHLADPARALPRPAYLKPPDAKPSAAGPIERVP